MTPRATLVSCLKDEGPFLIEWLAFHKAIGFTRFIIGANDCTDGSHEMLTRLADLGEIEYYPFAKPQDKGAQNTFAAILSDAAPFTPDEWVCWLDLDEFMNIHLGTGQLSDLTAALEPADGIRINWRIFGADAAVVWPNRQIDPTLCRCATATFGVTGPYRANRIFKSLFRFVDGMRVTPHGPVLNDSCVAKKPLWWNGNGRELRRPYFPYMRVKLKAGACPTYVHGKPAHDWVQINHYATRHPDLAEMRRQRGRGGFYVPKGPVKPGNDDYTARHSDAYFNRYNRTEDEDTSILQHLPAIHAEMARLLSDDQLKHWHDHAQTTLQQHLMHQKSGHNDTT